VDDSIVVLENIFRKLEEGDEPKIAAVRGRSEIGLAAIAITLVDVVVYAVNPYEIHWTLSASLDRLLLQFMPLAVLAALVSLLADGPWPRGVLADEPRQ